MRIANGKDERAETLVQTDGRYSVVAKDPQTGAVPPIRLQGDGFRHDGDCRMGMMGETRT